MPPIPCHTTFVPDEVLMSICIEGPEFGYFEVTIRQIGREDLIELVNCLTVTESPFIDSLRREIESELMEVR